MRSQCPASAHPPMALPDTRAMRSPVVVVLAALSLLVAAFGVASAEADAQDSWRQTRSGRLGGSSSTVDLSGASFGGDGTLWSVDNKLNRVVRWVEAGASWSIDGTWEIRWIDSTPTNDSEGISWIAPGRILVVDEDTNRALFISISGDDASLERAVDLTPWVGVPVGDALEAITYSAAESGASADVFYVGHEKSADLYRVVLPAGSSTPSAVAKQSLPIPEIAGLAIDDTSGEIYILSEADKTAYVMTSWGATPAALFSVPAMFQPEGIDVSDDGARIVIIGEGAQEYSEWTSSAPPRPTATATPQPQPQPQPTSTPPPPVLPPGGSAPEVPGGVDVPAGAQLSTASPRQSSDDAEQRGSSQMYLDSSDLEFLEDNGDQQQVGIRFGDVDVPAGAEILQAWIEFEADEVSTGQAEVRIRGEANANPRTFSSVSGNISARSTTNASVQWSPSPWPTIGAAHNTPDVARIVDEIVSGSGWEASQSIVFVFDGSGRRAAESFDGDGRPAELHIIWQGTAPAPVPQPTPTSPPQPRPTPRPQPQPTPTPRPQPSPASPAPGDEGAIRVSIASGADDVEQQADGSIKVGSLDLDFALSSNQPVGLRYDVCIPVGADVTSATITLVAKKSDTTPTYARVWTAAASDSAGFASKNLSLRIRSPRWVDWPSWSTWTPGRVEVSPDLSSLVSQVVDSPDWNGCGPIVFIIEGTGDREAFSYEADPAKAPVLEVVFG